MTEIRLPSVSRATDLDEIQSRVNAYQTMIDEERERRAMLTPAQVLAERLNSMFTREPGEAWYYEGENWNGSEHARWLAKADNLIKQFPDEDQRELVIEITRSMR